MKRNVLIIDNYDSFTYNLVHIVKSIEGKVTVVKNDQLEDLSVKDFTHVILSPGPGIPDEAGDLKKFIRQYGSSINILGVCLGLQAIAEVYGAKLQNLDTVFHGMRTKMKTIKDDCPLLVDVPQNFYAGRYHSWVIDRSSDTSALEIIVVDENDEIMAIRHKSFSVYGVQFHPESIMTDEGKLMVSNFLNLTQKKGPA